jgi:hypothetical protein
MEKTAKVKEVLSVREWTGQHGTIYFHKIELDNGDIGDIGKKVRDGIKPGDTLTYTIEQTEHGNRIKAVQPQGNGFRGGGKSSGSPASFALSYAKDLMIASMPFHQDVKVADWVDVTLAAANKFHTFLKERE